MTFPHTRGTVYGTLLNHHDALAALGEQVHAAPYKAPPKAPVLYIKPRNTWGQPGAAVEVPADAPELEMGATLGLVIGRTACRVGVADALSFVAGYVVMNDISVPHTAMYRPSMRFKCRDGFCPMGPVVPASATINPDALTITVAVDGTVVHRSSTAGLIRPVAQLLADVTEFMTLQPGDVLAVGVAAGAPRARAGQQVRIAIEGIGELEHTLVAKTDVPAAPTAPGTVAQPAAPQTGKTARVARVAYGGAIHTATPHPNGVQLTDGRVLAETDVVWLPPFEVGTVIALGLNYADHVKELSKELTVTTQDEPLAFLKSASGLIGHRAVTRRPDGVAFMHYECELAVVIGHTAKNVKREEAMQYVAGYTVANDYAIRDHLENYNRPNLRVKNRDGCTVLGPWFVHASEVPDPHNLALRTLVNGVVTQQGNTADLISDIPALIEYLSGFMTLQPGDVILTGTPDGVVNVGDEVVTEIDGIGRLVNTLVGAEAFSR
jgi:5-oxopent-3-ene-1,2,5-tricarboxylate decarboxylase/2-hydroxyhepta-2,4-diene-1,7-dioate isomerase